MYGFGGLEEVEVEIWLDVTIAGWTEEQTNERTRKYRATQPMDHGRLRLAKTTAWPALVLTYFYQT